MLLEKGIRDIQIEWNVNRSNVREQYKIIYYDYYFNYFNKQQKNILPFPLTILTNCNDKFNVIQLFWTLLLFESIRKTIQFIPLLIVRSNYELKPEYIKFYEEVQEENNLPKYPFYLNQLHYDTLIEFIYNFHILDEFEDEINNYKEEEREKIIKNNTIRERINLIIKSIQKQIEIYINNFYDIIIKDKNWKDLKFIYKLIKRLYLFFKRIIHIYSLTL